MTYTQELDYCFASAIGDEGIPENDFAAALKRHAGAIAASLSLKNPASRLRAIHRAAADISALENIAQTGREISAQFRHLVILGTGGSSLSAQAVSALTALERQHPGKRGITLHYIENIDPHTMRCMLDNLDYAQTLFIAVSKSGGTLETLSQFSLCLEAVEKKLGKTAIPQHFMIITDSKDSVLRRAGAALGVKVLDSTPEIGGRYSLLTNVGLLPAAAAGMDVVAICRGAVAMLERTFASAPENNAPLMGALVNILLMERGVHAAVFMPYADRLGAFISWHCQLWAESIGKKGRGIVPIKAAGTQDQHSQLQLYLDGSHDKFFTLFAVRNQEPGQVLSATFFDEPSMHYARGRTLGTALEICERATREALAKRGRPVRRFFLEKLDEETFGALAMHFMLETIITAELLGVDPFDTSAVEEGKVIARGYLNASPLVTR